MCCFFFNDTATTEIYTLSLHDALPISPLGPPPPAGPRRRVSRRRAREPHVAAGLVARAARTHDRPRSRGGRSEEHTSELQSRQYLVCRLLLEKKKDQSSFYYVFHY